MATRQATLVFLIKENQILLAMKKRGFGAGRWNGAGGKTEPGESIRQTAIRECQEEINITPLQMQEAAIIDFFFSEGGAQDQQVVVYACTDWQGVPTETEEMSPKWFGINEIPYHAMWPDDIYWLPEVLRGRNIKATFYLGKNDKVVKFNISPMV